MDKIIKYNIIGAENFEYDFLLAEEIKSVTSVVDKNGESWLMVSYIDPEFCITETVVCKDLKVEIEEKEK